MNAEQPTSAVPGSIEKIEVLVRRAKLGLPLWHPDDRCDCRGVAKLLVTDRQRRAARNAKKFGKAAEPIIQIENKRKQKLAEEQ